MNINQFEQKKMQLEIDIKELEKKKLQLDLDSKQYELKRIQLCDNEFNERSKKYDEEDNKYTKFPRKGIHFLCKQGNIEGVSMLIKKGIDLNIKDWEMKTPLDYACEYNNNDLINLLLQNGASA